MTDKQLQDRPWLLALDTSTDWAGVGLTNGSGVAELNWSAGRRQTVRILTEVEHLLETVGADISAIGAVAVALGPGSFSGLRVGLSIAKGMALAGDVEVIGVSTLAVTIDGWDGIGSDTVGVVKAGRSRYVWATAGTMDNLQSGPYPELLGAIASLGGTVTVVGEVVDSDAISLIAATGCHIPPIPSRLRRAGTLARIGYEYWLAGAVDDAATIEPYYIHPASR